MLKAKSYLVIAFVSIMALLVGACAQPGPAPSPAPSPTPPSSGTVEVYVTDAPPGEEVTSILVTASRLEIHRAVAEQEQSGSDNQTQVQTGSDNQSDNQTQKQEQSQTQQSGSEWIAIDISDNASTFDLIKIKGIEQFLGTNQVEAGKYTQIRLIVDKVEVALGDQEPQEATVPSNELKLVRPFDVVAGETTSILLDFDAEKSVNITGSGEIMVKPVIKLTIRQGKSQEKEGAQEPAVTPEPASLEVSCDDFMAGKHISRELEVNAGESFTVILCSNPTTGFEWSEAAEIGDQTVIQQIDHEFVTPASGASDQGKGKGSPPLAGAPGQEIWTFKALKAGTSTVSLEYSQPWEGGEKGEWTYVLTVTVK